MKVHLLSLTSLRASRRTMLLKGFSAADLGGQGTTQPSWGPSTPGTCLFLDRPLDCLSFKSFKGPEVSALPWIARETAGGGELDPGILETDRLSEACHIFLSGSGHRPA